MIAYVLLIRLDRVSIQIVSPENLMTSLNETEIQTTSTTILMMYYLLPSRIIGLHV